MQRLLGHDFQAFWAAAERWLMTVDDPRMVDAIGQHALATQESELAGMFVRRWARPSPTTADDQRVEPVLIQGLTRAADASESLTAMLHDRGTPWAEAAAAWTVVLRWHGRTEARSLLTLPDGSASGGSTLVKALRDATGVIDVLPRNAEGLAWLADVQADAAYWLAAAALRSSVPAEAAGTVELRHLPALLAMPAERWAWNSMGVRAAVRSRMRDTQTWPRAETAGTSIRLIDDDRATLNWADLLVVLAVLDAMNHPAVVEQWFDQAEDDRRDKTSEYGGVLAWDDTGELRAYPFEPDQRQGDRKFFSSPTLIRALYRGLAHYHFHAQSYDSAEFAGPGRGDLDFVESLDVNALTLTFISRHELNVDLTLPGRRVVDLGCVYRPRDPEPSS